MWLCFTHQKNTLGLYILASDHWNVAVGITGVLVHMWAFWGGDWKQSMEMRMNFVRLRLSLWLNLGLPKSKTELLCHGIWYGCNQVKARTCVLLKFSQKIVSSHGNTKYLGLCTTNRRSCACPANLWVHSQTLGSLWGA